MNRFAFGVVVFCLMVAGCQTDTPSDAYWRMERAAEPFGDEYYSDSPDASLAGIQGYERVMAAADPKVWKYMDQNGHMAFLHARVSLALERVGKTNAAAQYRKLAIHEFQRRKSYNNEYHTTFPVTPSPSAEEAERDLFFMVGKLDEHAKQDRDARAKKSDQQTTPAKSP
jgi:hypothetical protein